MDRSSDVVAGYPALPEEVGAGSSHRVKFAVGLAVFIVALGYLAFMAFSSATVYYLTVSELHQRGPTEDGRLVRVSGKLIPDSFTRGAGSTTASFTITDGDQSLGAVYEGVLPDLFFNEHSDVILEGAYTADGTFESYNVIIKCPSKFVAAS